VRDRSWTPGTVRAPGFASDDAGNVLVALEERGNILIGRLAAGTTQVELLGSQDVSAVDDGKTLADPALLWHPTRGWLLYYTILDGETASIGRAVSGTGETFTPDAEPVLRATAATPRFEQPTVATHLSDQLVMIVRTTDDDGVTQLAAYRSLGGVSWTHVETSHLEALTRRGDVSHDGFTADDVAHPSLVVHNGAWQVYYAGRRGTRWSIGLLASDELLHWRDVGLVLSGDGNGFDRLGASAPAARSVADRVELLFEGHDGVYTSIGFAARPSTSSGARL
jgi:hypothetical protein